MSSITFKPGCKVTTEQYTFTSPIGFNVESDFLIKIMKIPMINFTDEHGLEELSSRLRELQRMETPDKIHLDTLKNWIRQEKSRAAHQVLAHSTSSVAVMCSIAVILVFLILYWRYKKISEKQNRTEQKSDKDKDIYKA